MGDDIVRFSNIAKRFGDVEALKELTFSVAAGQAVALLGPNGAGKTTALTILLGLRPPSAGEVTVFGLQPGQPAALRRTGVTPQATDFPPQMTPRELLRFATAHYPVPAAVDELIERFGLAKLADRRAKGFSGGEKRRVALAMAFAGHPDLVVLDEPTTGLDARAQAAFHAVARQYVEAGGALLMTSHYWHEIESVAERIVLIDEGRVAIDGRIDAIRERVNMKRLSFAAAAVPEALRARLTRAGGRWRYAGPDTDAVLREIIAAGVEATDILVEPLGLEEVLDLLNGQPGRAAA